MQKAANPWDFCHGMGNLLSVRRHWASENLSESVDVATEAGRPMCSQHFAFR